MIIDLNSNLGESPSEGSRSGEGAAAKISPLDLTVGMVALGGAGLAESVRKNGESTFRTNENLLKPSLIPPSVRILARECAEAGIAVPVHNGWRIFPETVTLEQSVRGALCVYGVEGLTLDSVHALNLTRAVCESPLRVRSPLKEAIELVAPKVILHSPVQFPISIHANVLVSYHALPEGLVTLHTADTVVHILTPCVVPSSLSHATVHLYDAPRVALKPNANQTTEMCGFSIWHLLALGILQGDIINEFLASLEGVDQTTLVTDMMETMTFLNDNHRDDAAKMNLPGLEWEEVRALTAFRNPFELCAQSRREFLAAYAYDLSLMPPIVAKLISDTKSFIQ